MVFYSSEYTLSDNKVNEDLTKLIELNMKIHNSFEYGIGLPGYPTLAETISFGNGHCGLYATYFTEEAKKMGFEPKILDLISNINNEIELYHSVVTINLGNANFVFDPTLGIYYKSSVSDLIHSPLLADKKIGMISNASLKKYSTQLFWGNISGVKIYHDLDYYQTDLTQSQEFEITSENSFYESPYDLRALFDGKMFDNYAASEDGVTPVTFTIKFQNPVEVNRIFIGWFDRGNYPKKFTIYNDKDQEIIKMNNYKNNIGYLNKWLNSTIKTESLTFSFEEFEGQQRLLLRKLAIY